MVPKGDHQGSMLTNMWKGRMLMFLSAHDPLLIKFMNEGPYIPHIILERNPTASGSDDDTTYRTIVKPISQRSDADRMLVDGSSLGH